MLRVQLQQLTDLYAVPSRMPVAISQLLHHLEAHGMACMCCLALHNHLS
jgi:hypothetical protein